MKLPSRSRSLRASLSSSRLERKRLRGAAELAYAVADSIHMLDSTSWRALTEKAGFFMSLEYLSAMESVLPGNISPCYALIYSDGGRSEVRIGDDHGRQPIAAMYMQRVAIGLNQLRREKSTAQPKKWLTPLTKLGERATQHVLTCGNFLAYGQHGIALASDADTELAWHGVAEVLYRVRQADRLRSATQFVLIKDLHAPWTAQAKRLSDLSYRFVETEPNMVLALGATWKSHDDYLASLTAKYRTNIRNQVLKPIDGAGCVVEHLADLSPMLDRIFELYKSVQTNASIRPFELIPEYFLALQRVAGGNFRCSVVRQGDRLLGFMISVADGETGIAYHVGFDREAAGSLPIYLRLLHAAIADCIAMGCRRISFGRTALEPKAALGAKPESYGILLRHRQPVLNKLIKRLLLNIEHAEAPERNPFKNVASPVT